MTDNSRRQAGFTLLEILIALVVFSLVLLVLQQGFQTATILFERQHGALASQAELGGIDRLLRGLVTRADPGTGQEGPLFVGQAHGLVLRGTLPIALSDRLEEKADIRLSVDSRHRLQLIWLPYRHVIEPVAPERQQTLLTNVSNLDCAYFSNGHWNTTWDADHLPTLVRIRIRFPDGDLRHWPDIVAAPLLDPMP